ncbi:MAG: methyl-accepting chemotaxis protein [Magnetococcales bacterium]|nr:methyl-accepting chemotaxis protein [Magnetococcales bacterium]
MSDKPTDNKKRQEDAKKTAGGPQFRSQSRPDSPIIPIGNHSDCGNCSAMVLDQFAKSFDKSAKRWELIVYPSLLAFIFLALYGFFLIYSLTQDIRTMATSIDPKMGMNMGGMSTNIKMLSDNVQLISTHLEYISDNMETMSMDMQSIAQHINTMTGRVDTMASVVTTMNGHLSEMNTSVAVVSKQMEVLPSMADNLSTMTKTMHVMTGSVSRMGYDVGRPMSFINRFMPW